MIRFFVILAIFISYSLFKATQLAPDHKYQMILIAIILFALMISSMFLGRKQAEHFETLWFKALVWFGTLFMGFFGSFVLISLPIDMLHFFVSLIAGKTFITTEGYQYIFYAGLVITFFGFLSVLIGPNVKEVSISLSKQPAALNGFKIAQISDLHVGPTIQTRYVEKVVKRVNETDPDVIVITGDLVDSHTESIEKHLAPLRNLKSRYGIYYVTGNHEYYWSLHTLLPLLEKMGFQALINHNKMIEHNGEKILLAGVPDPMGTHFHEDHKPDIKKARAHNEEATLNVLLAHRPDPYEAANQLGFHLQFSGHTHAGQFFPFSLLIPLAHKYYRGLNKHGDLWLYVNPGTGYWGPANRFGIASEITLAKLKTV